MPYTFEYSPEFKEMVVDLQRGKESLPHYQEYVSAHLGGSDGRLCRCVNYLCPEILYHCGDLNSKRVLDFGCGTGSTTAALAMECNQVVAFDIDNKSLAICKKRLEEHNLIERVDILSAPDFEDVKDKIGTFYLILINGVIEHIPLSMTGLRKRLILSLFDILDEQGYLYINETPNRLNPLDIHTTNLWWIPWTKPGSKWAYLTAVKKGRHLDNPETHSDGPLGLEERGAWGATFFEIKKYLSGVPCEFVNSLPGHNRHLVYTHLTAKRHLFDFFVYSLITKWTKIPITAFARGISHMVIRKSTQKA